MNPGTVSRCRIINFHLSYSISSISGEHYGGSWTEALNVLTISASVPLNSLRQHRDVDLYGRHPWARRVAVARVAGGVGLRRSIALRGGVTLWGGVAVGHGSSHLWTVPVWSRHLRHVHLCGCRGNHALRVALGWHIWLGVDHCGRIGLWWEGLRTINRGGRISVGRKGLGGQRSWHGGQGQPEGRRQLFTHTVPHEHQQGSEHQPSGAAYRYIYSKAVSEDVVVSDVHSLGAEQEPDWGC